MIQSLPEKKYVQIREILDLPPLPSIAQMVLAEISKEDVRIERLAAVIEKDPGLVGRIVGLANSAFFGCTDHIYTVSDAILRVLGLNMVKSLAFSIVLSSPMRSSECPGFRLDEYWYVAMLTASLAPKLARQVPDGDADLRDNAYLCGLLHSFGLLVLAHSFPAELAQVLRDVPAWDEEALERRERELLGVSHNQAGAALGRKWHLPEGVITAIERHTDPHYRGKYWQLAVLVGLCARLATREFHEQGSCSVPEDYLQALNLSADNVTRACEELQAQNEEIRQMAQLLSRG